MTLTQMREIATQHDMQDLLANEITREVIGLCCTSRELIPELDELMGNPLPYVIADRTLAGDEYLYRVYLPQTWIDALADR